MGAQGDGRIAVIGMAGRFPGANSVEALWRILDEGRDAVTDYSDAELLAAGVTPELVAHPDYVKSGAHLLGAGLFDATFFGYTGREAELMDPQQRIFLEVCHEALEESGHGPRTFPGPVGIYAGPRNSDYTKLLTGTEYRDVAAEFAKAANAPDGLATKVAYKLDLTGPALTVQTACSTSLVAVHLACQQLLGGECDLALAGGVSLRLPQHAGYLYREGGTLSRTGRCRSFDAAADGLIFGDGAAVVVLRRLSDALADGDRILAVIRGSAVNNDGARRAGYAAPGLLGQAKAIREAIVVAGLEPTDVSYVEAHGAGTPLGDRVEFSALTRAFETDERGFCALGSVKANVGHLDCASGVTGLIKTVLSIRHGRIPGNPQLRVPNPELNLIESPFYLAAEGMEWNPPSGHRIAGVSSLGIGGTNVHVVVEEAPMAPPAPRSPARQHLIVLSARSPEALEQASDDLRRHLEEHTDADLADIAFTLRNGRQAHRHRRAVLADTCASAARAIRDGDFVTESTTVPRHLSGLVDGWLHGREVAWQPLDAGQPGRRLSLPTHPMFREHHWPVTPAEQSELSAPAGLPEEETETMDSFLAELTALIAARFKVDPALLDPDVPFLEIGADSLALLNVLAPIEDRYGVRLSIRQFFDEVGTLSELADYLRKKSTRPEAPEAARPPVPLTTPVGEPEGSGVPLPSSSTSEVERLLADQMRLMHHQLQVISGMATGPHQIGPSPAVTAVPVVPGTTAPTAPTVPAVPLAPGKRREPGRGVADSARRDAYLQSLAARYTARTAASKAYAERFRRIVADSRSTIGFRMSTKEMLYPIVADRGQGARLWDIDGNEYIDLTLGFGVHLFGHNPALVTRAIAERMETGFSLGPRSELVNDVAESILALTGMDRLAFLNSGSEAVVTALKLARAATGREKIVIFETGYHGHSEGVLAAPNRVGGELRAKPLAIGVTQGAIDSVYVLDFGTEQALEFIDRHGSELAAVLTEPITTRHPGVQEPDFLRRLRELTWKHGAKLIFDEMVTGFRCHPGGVQGLYGIEADLATYGKIIGGGLPLGVVAGRHGAMDAIDGGVWRFGDGSHPTVESTFFGGTFNQHPLTMAVAKASLDELLRQGPGLQQRLDTKTKRFVDAMNADFQALEAPIGVNRFSSFYRFTHDANMDLFYYNMLDRGIFIWEWRNCFLSTAHEDEDLDLVREAARESIAELRDNGLIPPPSRPVTPVAPPLAATAPSGGGAVPPAVSAPAPLTAASRAQQQLWALANVSAEGSLAYTLFAGFWLDGQLDRGALRSAVYGVIERHHALRTVFTEDGASTRLLSMEELARREVFSEAECAESEVGSFLDAQARRPLDVLGGPLLRICLVRVGADKHLLHLAVHHAIADGWSLLPWIEDLAALYNDELGSPPARGLPAPVQFAEFLAWQAGQAGSARSREDRIYWSTLLDGAPAPELLGGRGARLPSFRTQRHRFELDRESAGRLRAAARANRVTLFAFLVAGWGVLQHRLTGQDDVVVFAPSSARPDRFERTVGYCANQMALRLRTKSDTEVSACLRTAQDQLLDALEHADFPFAEVVADLDAREPGLARRLFRSSIVLDRRVDCPELVGLRMSEVEHMPLHCSPYALSLQVVDTAEGGLRFELDVDAEALPPGLAEDLVGHLTRVLDHMAADGGRSLQALDLLDDTAREKVLELGRGPAAELGSQRIPELFDEIAAADPGRVAVTCEGRELTYEALSSASNRLARVLKRKLPQDGGEAFVGLRLPRSEQYLVALLAVWKAGAAYVPMEPKHPIERHVRMLELAGVEFVLCDEPAGAAPGVRWLRLADALAEAEGQDAAAVGVPTGLDAAAYVMFTSGSTGEPKGIVIEHRSMLNHVRAMVEAFGIATDSVVAQNALSSFDVSVWQWTAALTAGGSVAVCTDAEVAEPRRMLRQLAEARVTDLGLVPSYLTMLLDEADLREPEEGPLLPDLRHVVLNAEPLKPVLVERWYDRFPGVPLSNAYGATETADDVMIPVTGVPDGLVTPTGGPIANTSVYVVDDALRPVPVGVKGEILVAGVAVGRGYLNAVGAAAGAFLDVNPVEPGRPGRVYRTGDLGRWRPDGQLEVLGRRDHQVKVRGQRVEFGEIERVLHRVPGVANAVVKAFHDAATDGPYLAGYVVPAPGAALDMTAIRAALQAKLPDYMVPARLVVQDALALNATGKVDRMALAEPAADDERPVTRARHSLDEKVIHAVASLFGLDRVGIDDDFFALGGNSIAAVRLSQRLRTAIGADVPVMTIFDHPVLRDLADVLEAGTGQQTAGPAEPDADRDRVLRWGRGADRDLGSATVAELFAARAAREPDRPALIVEGRELTYGELDAQANRLARALRRSLPAHPGRETFVGVRLPRSDRFLVALLAVWKAGAAYVPLEPDHPIERQARMLELAGVEVVLCDELADQVPGHRWLGFADLLAEAGEEDPAAAGLPAGLDAAAYVMFTSGSTGEPKGIVIEHRSMLNHVLAKTDSYEVDSGTLLVQNAPVSVDVAIWQFFAPLLAGGRVLVPSDAEISDPKAFLRVLDDRPATVVELVPSFLAVLLDELDLQDRASGTVLPKLRHMVLNAEPLKPVLVERWYDRFPGVPLSNAYGATETADDIMHPRTEIPDGLVTPTGGPIANTSVYVVDDALRPVPVGVKGEILVAGVAVGRGYLNAVGAAAGAFLDVNPVEPGRPGRVYRTGDLGRWRPDGQLEVLGRRDHQVKVRGQRVEFGEIERVLHRVPGVADAVVKAFPQVSGDHSLVAYLLPSPGTAPDVEEIRAVLRAKLPGYMVPARFVISETFALTTTGKVDRMALAEPAADDERPVTRARHSLDEKVIHAVASLFGLDRVGIDDDFFALGGNSIAAVRLSQRLRTAIGADVPVMTIFDHPVLRDLADALTAEAGALEGMITQAGERTFYRASASEERMFFLWTMEPRSCLYNLPLALVVDGRLDRDRLTRAVNAVVAKHDILRTVFDVREGALVQRVLPGVALTVADLGESEEALEDLVARWIEPHDLRTGPPIRLGLALRPGGRASILVLDTPHIVLDEGSIPVLFRDLAAAYRGEALDRTALTYKDFAEWEHLYRTTDAYREDRRYWLERLASPPAPLDFPMRARPPVLTTQGRRQSFFLSAELAGKLKEYCRENRVTPYMVLLSVYKLMLAKYAGRADIVVGTPVDGRYHPACADVVGMFGNSLPIRSAPVGSKRFGAFVAEVRSAVVEGLQRQSYPFEELVRELELPRDPSRNPLFDFMFVYTDLENYRFDMGGSVGAAIPVTIGVAKLDLTLSAFERDSGIELVQEYSTGVFDRLTIERMGAHYTNLVEQVLDHPEQTLDEFVLDPGEQSIVGRRDRSEEPPAGAGLGLHQVFEAVADRMPDHTAVVSGSVRLTYRELDERANRLAHRLRGAGVGAGTPVGLLVQNPHDTITGMLGVLKAGGCYVPFDETTPAARAFTLLAECGAPCVVGDEGAGHDLPDGLELLDLREEGSDPSRPEPLGSDRDLAYIMFTSGSTGRPKGVLVEHASVRRLTHRPQYLPVSGGERVLQATSWGFDVSAAALYTALLNGGTVVCPRRDELLDVHALRALVEGEDVDLAFLSTGFFHLLVDRAPECLDPIGTVVVAGERLSAGHARRTVARLGAGRLVNAYGPTEGTIYATAHAVDHMDGVDSVPIGRPVDETEVYILLPGDVPAPIGIAGELCIGGRAVARGYLRPSDRDPFQADPFIEGGRIYRTGDLARWLPDGTIEYLGRRDDQVKIRGFRVELAEVETELRRCDGVVDAAATVLTDAQGMAVLWAYLVGPDEAQVPSITTALRSALPDYMVPARFVVLDRLPLNANGKVDRPALDERARNAAEGGQIATRRTETEEVLMGIYRDKLGLAGAGPDDDFFGIGGHSLKAVVLIAEIREALGVEVRLMDFLPTPTIRALAEHVDNLRWLTTGGAPQDGSDEDLEEFVL
ncbi:amino acid adenylation domain-containing protein [Nonomuraea sp. JJY05]|uniref:amino acid adenylation domain-containing protein n=1 Tax=Nonomuraea sp. JJY05 TaxID=3350255 RepID=UPI00373F3982